ncbi:hypothetical protein CAP36_05115 [Chitinophagaceae bacterium IBVUCB2]|nr:hypothetical protein CAP36_05115 [Chitinophagaceae bacterium IBVUCB2]
MKKISTLLLSSLFSLSLLAFDGNRLSVATVSNGMNLSIEIDGRKFKMQDNSITLSNLAEGNHNIRIYRDKKKNGNGFGQAKKQEIIYASNVYLKRGFHTDITVSRFGKVLVDERRIANNDSDEWFEDEDVYDDGSWDNGYNNVMTARDFESVKEQIRKEWFESSRLVSVKTIISKNNFTTQQVKEMMLLFTFENNRLEVAKAAYRRTVDKQRYFELNDAFTYSSSRDELARFIRESR